MKSAILASAAAALATACATVPTGPSVMTLPGDGKSFEQFQTDDAICRQWASQQTGTTAQQASTSSAVSGAAVGTAVGAAAGAGIGAAAGAPATGAAAGAGLGLLGGTTIGASEAQGASVSAQRRYDVTYLQCMYAKGHQIPVARGSESYSSPAPPAAADSLSPGVPPPPAGPPPPSPPGVSR